MAASSAWGGARALPFPFAFAVVVVFGIGEGLPSDVGGVGWLVDCEPGVPNRNCGVVFVEDETSRDGDDNESSARNSCNAC